MLEIATTASGESSLFLVSLFGFVDAGAVAAFAGMVGSWIDRRPRLKAAKSMFFVQNVSVAISAACCLPLLAGFGLSHGQDEIPIAYISLVGVAMLAGAVSSLGATGATLSVEREWVKALCRGNTSLLAESNAMMKRIDLVCLILSPLFVGLIMTHGPVASVWWVWLWHVVAWWPECFFLEKAQRLCPYLAMVESSSPDGDHGTILESTARTGVAATSDNGIDSHRQHSRMRQRLNSMVDKFKYYLHLDRRNRGINCFALYWKQWALPAAVALALLYLTVMSFGILMTAYLKWKGLGETTLALYRGGGAISGIFATVAFPHMHKQMELMKTGMFAIWFQLLCLVSGLVPLLLFTITSKDSLLMYGNDDLIGSTPTAMNKTNDGDTPAQSSSYYVHSLLIGLTFSRFGLWLFDLSVNQLLQETVSQGILATVTGVQSGLQSTCQLASFAVGMMIPKPEDFAVLMIGSAGVVTASACIFSAFALKSRFQHVSMDAKEEEEEEEELELAKIPYSP